MATVTEDARTGVNAQQALDPVTAARYGTAATPITGGDAANFNSTGEMLKGRMPDLVKGEGLAGRGGNTVLSDPGEIAVKASRAMLALRTETAAGFSNRSSVVKSFKPDFMNQFGALRTALESPSLGEQIGEMFKGMNPDVAKSFTAGNLGISSIYGLTPFNLLAPSRLIYPVYTVDN